MKPFKANILNSIILIGFGFWGYFGSISPSPTALIPVYTGVILLILTRYMIKGNRHIAHIVVLLTLLILIALIKPLIGVIERNEALGLFRVSAMMFSSAYALVMFIRSFFEVRRARKE